MNSEIDIKERLIRIETMLENALKDAENRAKEVEKNEHDMWSTFGAHETRLRAIEENVSRAKGIGWALTVVIGPCVLWLGLQFIELFKRLFPILK